MPHLSEKDDIQAAMLLPACFSREGMPVQGCSPPLTRSPNRESGFVLCQFRNLSLVPDDSLEYR